MSDETSIQSNGSAGSSGSVNNDCGGEQEQDPTTTAVSKEIVDPEPTISKITSQDSTVESDNGSFTKEDKAETKPLSDTTVTACRGIYSDHQKQPRQCTKKKRLGILCLIILLLVGALIATLVVVLGGKNDSSNSNASSSSTGVDNGVDMVAPTVPPTKDDDNNIFEPDVAPVPTMSPTTASPVQQDKSSYALVKKWGVRGQTLGFGNPMVFTESGNLLAIRSDRSRGMVWVHSEQEQWNHVFHEIGMRVEESKFGSSLSLSGDGTALAVGSKGNKKKSGSVRIYQIASSSGEESSGSGELMDILKDENSNGFGISVDLSFNGSVLAIASTSGVNVFEMKSNGYEDMNFNVSDVEGDHNHGWTTSLSHDGMTIAVGIPRRTKKELGYARVYGYNGQEWISRGLNYTTRGKPPPRVSLSGNGNIVAVRSGKEPIHVFRFDGNEWNTELVPQQDDQETNKGGSVTLSSDGNTLVGTGQLKSFVYWYRDGEWKDLLRDHRQLYDTQDIYLSGNGQTAAVRYEYQSEYEEQSFAEISVFEFQ